MSGGSTTDVFVTYADQGNIRTVVETRPAVGGYYDEAAVEVAYVDLTLWRETAAGSRRSSERRPRSQERGAQTLTHANVPVGISLAQFQQQYPQCRAIDIHPVSGFGWAFPALTGYVPPFPDLLPNYQGSHLTTTVPWQAGNPMPTLGRILCPFHY